MKQRQSSSLILLPGWMHSRRSASQLDRRTVRSDVEEPSYLPDKGQLHIIRDDEELSGQKKALWLERFAELYEKSVTAP